MEKESWSIISVAFDSAEDVNKHNRKVQELDYHNKRKEEITKCVQEKRKLCRQREKEYESIPYYFYPQQSICDNTVMNGSTLTDVIVVMYDGGIASICLPENKTFNLPVSYTELDGNQISIPYYSTSNEVKLVLRSDDCDLSESSNRFVFIMKDNEIGQKSIKVDIVVYRIVDNERIAYDTFFLSYNRVAVANRIETSHPCTLIDHQQYYNIVLYPSQLPLDVDVYLNNKKNTFHVGETQWKRILQNPNTFVASTKVRDGHSQYGSLFTWDENHVKLFVREETLLNSVIVPIHSMHNMSSAIRSVKSQKFSCFVNCFANLPIAMILANESDKYSTLSLLNGCINDTILPSIKRAAEYVVNMITHKKSNLQWITLDTVSDYTTISKPASQVLHNENPKLYQPLSKDDKSNTSVHTSSQVHYRELPTAVMERIHDYVNEVVLIETAESVPVQNSHFINTLKCYGINEVHKSVNYSEYLNIIDKMPMDDIFSLVYKRRTTKRYVQLLSNSSSILSETFCDKDSEIDQEIVKTIISTSANIIETLYQTKCMNRKPHALINIIIDTNCSLRKNKLRMRTIISCILMTVMKELGILFNIYVFCGRYKGIYIPIEGKSIREIISFLFDVERVVKIPSTPLDLLCIQDEFDDNNPIVIISDGFSEQLMSQTDEVKEVFKQYKKLFLLCLKGRNDEALSGTNQSLLESSLKDNFDTNMINIETMDDIMNDFIGVVANILFDMPEKNKNSTNIVINANQFARNLNDNLFVEFSLNKSIVLINTVSNAIPPELVNITGVNLTVNPDVINDNNVLKELNKVIQGENLFDAMSRSLFVPNKSTAYIPSTSGTSINMTNYIKYVVSKTGDGKFFKKLGSEKIRSYNASIVIDCSSIAFSETNRVHSLITIFSILRNLSNMQLPCIDLWVASNQIIRIATGLSSQDLWESNIVAALYQYLLSSCENTCLPDCIRYACFTCNARSLPSVMMVLTNGVLCDESRAEIKSIVSGIEMTYLGIGIGLYLCGFDDLFPTMIWNSNPYHLSETMMNMTNASKKGEQNAVPEKKIDGLIMNGTFDLTYGEMIQRICYTPSVYEMALSNVRFVDKTDGEDSMEMIGNIDDSRYDLGMDGAFKDYSILFIILYLCRGKTDENGNVVDEYITEDVLRNGKVTNEEIISPVLKLGDKIINGIPIGKGFEIHYAYDYKSAIRELMSGKHRMTFITCSPGDGIMAKECDDDVDQYADRFVSCVHEFNRRGGGVFWFLENYPFTFEADLYFKKFYGFEAVGDKDKNIQGGKVMVRVKSETPKAGQFITIGGDILNFYSLTRLDFGIVSIFEGRTLCTLNERELTGNRFRVFARESEGNASIMVREKQEGSSEGRMIIDTAASKLFLEFTEEGTARWISNAAVWLCNTEEFVEERSSDSSLTSGIKMDGVILPEKKLMDKRRTECKKVNFCLSIVMDTTGSMSSYIKATKERINEILEKVKQIEKYYELEEGGIVGQVVQYKDFKDELTGELEEYITNDFDRLKNKLASFEADGGGDTCEDIQGGLIRALEQMRQPEYKDYNHLVLIVADAHNHEDGKEDDGCDYYQNVTYEKSFASVWEDIYDMIRDFHKIRIMFMPVSNHYLERTAKILEKGLGSLIVNTSTLSTEENYGEAITRVVTSEYKRFISIS